MGKLYKMIALALCTGLLLTGCQANTIPTLSEEQSNLISEYAASLILKHDKNHSSGIASQEEKDKAEKERLRALKREEIAKAAENADKDESANKSDTAAEAAPVYVDIAQFLELEGTTIEYQGFEISDSYSEDGGDVTSFAMEAPEGKKLLVVKFNLSTSEDKEVDILSKYPLFRIRINDGSRIDVLTTMLLNDLSTYKETVTAGTLVETVLIAAITQEEADSIQSLVLSTKYGETSADTLLQ